MSQPKYICLEEPDKSITVDFLGTNSRKKKDRRACIVTLTVEDGKLYIVAKGCDDRATILFDEAVDDEQSGRK